MAEYQNVRISFTEGCEETVNVIPLGTNYYHLDSTPLTAGERVEVYFGDVIEVEKQKKGVLRFRRVVERSTWRHWDWLLPLDVLESSALVAFQEAIVASGGAWERIFGGLLLVHLPEGTALDPEAELEKVLFKAIYNEAERTPAVPLHERIWHIQKRSQRYSIHIRFGDSRKQGHK